MNKSSRKNIATHNSTLISSGTNFFDQLERIIDAAKTEIHFQTYIFENDTTGQQIVNALKRAASRNVKIYLLLDVIIELVLC